MSTASNGRTAGPIVVGIDDSETARLAARRAAELAASLGVDLHVVSAVSGAASKVVTVGSDEFVVDSFADAKSHLQAVALELDHDRVSTSLGDGDPAKALVRAAETVGAQVIVVGNRRVQGVSRVLGSVASDVLRHAPCDVVVVNTTADS